MTHEFVNYSETEKAEFLERAARLEHRWEVGDWAWDGKIHLVVDPKVRLFASTFMEVVDPENPSTPNYMDPPIWLPTVDDLIQLPEWEFMLTPSTRHVTNGGDLIEVPDWVVLGHKEIDAWSDDMLPNDPLQPPPSILSNIAIAKHRTLAALRAVTGWVFPDPLFVKPWEEEE